MFLKNFRSFGREIEPLAAIETEILHNTGALTSALPMPAMRREGVDL